MAVELISKYSTVGLIKFNIDQKVIKKSNFTKSYFFSNLIPSDKNNNNNNNKLYGKMGNWTTFGKLE